MFGRSTLVVLSATTLSLGAWGVTDAMAQPTKAPEAQPEKKRAPKTTAEAMPQDTQEWVTAWNELTPKQRENLIAAARQMLPELRALSDEQEATVSQALDRLASTAGAGEGAGASDREAMGTVIATLRTAYTELTTEQKARFLSNVADSIGRAQQQMQQQEPPPPEGPAQPTPQGR